MEPNSKAVVRSVSPDGKSSEREVSYDRRDLIYDPGTKTLRKVVKPVCVQLEELRQAIQQLKQTVEAQAAEIAALKGKR